MHLSSLCSLRFQLHWRVDGTTLYAALQALPGSGGTKGWISVGWSPDGKMVNSDAMVGNLAGVTKVKAYYLATHKITRPTTTFSIGTKPAVISNTAGLFVT